MNKYKKETWLTNWGVKWDGIMKQLARCPDKYNHIYQSQLTDLLLDREEFLNDGGSKKVGKSSSKGK